MIADSFLFSRFGEQGQTQRRFHRTLLCQCIIAKAAAIDFALNPYRTWRCPIPPSDQYAEEVPQRECLEPRRTSCCPMSTPT